MSNLGAVSFKRYVTHLSSRKCVQNTGLLGVMILNWNSAINKTDQWNMPGFPTGVENMGGSSKFHIGELESIHGGSIGA